MADDDARQRKLAGLKKGGGVGRKGGFGYLHDRRFAEPFAKAVREVMKSHALPADDDSVDARLTLHIIADLKRNGRNT
jgi:hypothetical protein